MKRRISLLLAVVMILGTFSFTFAAEATPEEVAGEFLMDNDVIEGINGELKLEDNFRRQDMVVMISRLMGAADEAAEYPTDELTFTDFSDPYYRPIIAWAVAEELIEGHTDERFGFGEDVTAQQYATVLLRALGYNDEVAGDGYDEALELAADLGILGDYEFENDDAITRGEMFVMTFNALGVTMKDSDETLADFLGIEMPEEPKAEKLEVVDVYTENLAEIVVELSNAELVENKDALLNPANYRLSNGVVVQHVDLDGDNVILTLVPYGEIESLETPEVLVKGRTFNLTIRNIDPAINKTYRNILANDNAIPVVEDVEFIGTHGIKVTTSEPIANPLERNFRLDSRTSMIVEQYGREIILTPYHGKAFDEDAVELTIDKLEDFAGYTSVKTVEEMEISDDDALPEVEAAYRSGSKLIVVFDRDVYHDSISAYANRRNVGNVAFVERRATFYAETANKVDTNVVEYTFERDIPKGVEIEIEGVANHFNKAMEKDTIIPVEYDDEYAPIIISSTEKVKITQAFENDLKALENELSEKDFKDLIDDGYPVNTQEMTITFDKDIAEFVVGKDETKAEVKDEIQEDIYDYFTLYELDVTKRGEVSEDEVQIIVKDIEDDKIKLTFEGINLNNRHRDYDYVLEVKNFSDLSRNRMDREYLDFQVVRIADAFDVETIKIKENSYFNRDGVEIVLEFNGYVDKASAQDETNYYLDGELAIDEAIVERDGKTVSLILYDYEDEEDLLDDYEVLEISPRVLNLDEDASVANRFWGLYLDPIAPITDPAEIKGAIIAAEKAIADLPAVDELTLEDKEDVEKARESVNEALELDENAEIEGLNILVTAEAKIVELEAEKAIEDLPQEITLIENVIKAVNAARELVDEALDLNPEAEIEGLDVLVAAEQEIERLNNEEIAGREAEVVAAVLEAENILDLSDALVPEYFEDVERDYMTVYLNELASLDPDTTTIEDIQDVINAVNDAMDDLAAAKAEVDALVEEEYTTASWTVFDTADTGTRDTALALPETTLTEINAKITAIENAIDGLDKLVATSIVLEDEDGNVLSGTDTIVVPNVPGAVMTKTYTATVQDQESNALPEEEVVWTIADTNGTDVDEGYVTIENGVVSVTDEATAGSTFTVTAISVTVDTVFVTITVTLN